MTCIRHVPAEKSTRLAPEPKARPPRMVSSPATVAGGTVAEMPVARYPPPGRYITDPYASQELAAWLVPTRRSSSPAGLRRTHQAKAEETLATEFHTS